MWTIAVAYSGLTIFNGAKNQKEAGGLRFGGKSYRKKFPIYIRKILKHA